MSVHHHNHTHDHDHHDVFHSHAPAGKMKWAFLLTGIIFVVEVFGGWMSGSLALLSDAGHVLTDIGALGLSWYAMKQADKPSNRKMTYGYYRAGILAAFINGIVLILITLWILWQAYNRFRHVEHVAPTWMFISAAVGLGVNLYLGFGMRHDGDINVKSAVLHILGDAAASAGVIVGGIIILFTHWYLIDPILSVLIALLISLGAWRIVRQTVVILMEGTPKDVDVSKVVEAVLSVPGVHNVHDLHVWTITSGKNAMSCHIALGGSTTISESQATLQEIEHRLAHLNILHVTVQTEDQNHPHEDTLLCATIEGHR